MRSVRSSAARRTSMCWRPVASHSGSPANGSSRASARRAAAGTRAERRGRTVPATRRGRAAHRSTRRRTALRSTSCAGDSTGSHWRSSWRRRRPAPSIRLDWSTFWTIGSSCSVPITARAMPGTRRCTRHIRLVVRAARRGRPDGVRPARGDRRPVRHQRHGRALRGRRPEFDVITSLASLVDKSLVQRLASSPPFRLLESLREFSLEQLVAAGADRSVHRRTCGTVPRPGGDRCAGRAWPRASLRSSISSPPRSTTSRPRHDGRRLTASSTGRCRSSSTSTRSGSNAAGGRPRRGSLTAPSPARPAPATRGPTSSPRRRRRHSTSSGRWAGPASSPRPRCPSIPTTPRR